MKAFAAGFLVLGLIASCARAEAPWLPPGTRPRLAWGAAPVGAGVKPQVPRRVTVHHTETRAGAAEAQVASHLKSVQRYHQNDKHWPDIAYHILIDSQGRPWEGRSLAHRGDSGTTYDLSDRALICLIGKFNEDQLSDVQWQALVQAVAEVCKQYRIPTTEITMHRQLAQSDCPGNNVAVRVADGSLKRAVDAYLVAHR